MTMQIPNRDSRRRAKVAAAKADAKAIARITTGRMVDLLMRAVVKLGVHDAQGGLYTGDERAEVYLQQRRRRLKARVDRLKQTLLARLS